MRKRSFISAILYALIISMLIGTLGIFAGAVSGNGITVEGAQIRTEGVQGLRFVAKVERAKFNLTTGENANFGILLIPASMIGENENITVDTHTVKNVKAKNLMSQTEEYYEFTAVLLNIPAEFYGMELVARAYVKQGDDYTYSEQLTRSVKFVAEAILKDSDASETDVAVANAVLKAYAEVGGDMLVNADEIWNGPSVLTAYPEYPDCIARDYMYSVSVSQKTNTEELVVYNQTQDYFYTGRFAGDNNRRFCEFAFSGAEVTVNVKVNTDFSTYAVIPTSKGFESTYSDGVISIKMDKPEQLAVILDDDVDTALAIFADAPETEIPAKDSDNTVYVEGNSVVTINDSCATLTNGVLTIPSTAPNDVKVYIAPGAVLKARIVSEAYRVKIFGRGAILDPFSNIYEYDPSTAATNSLVKITGYTSTIKDVKLLDARCFNLNLNQGYATADNVKILSTMMTSDGITATAEGTGETTGYIRNCFVYCGDNALVTQVGSGKTGYTFDGWYLGSDKWSFMGFSITEPITLVAKWIANENTLIFDGNGNTTFTDIYVFRADEGLINMKQTSTNTKSVVINNLDALDCVRTPWLLYATNQGDAAKTVTLNKVLMRYTTGEASATAAIGTTTGAKTMFYGGSKAGSGFTLNITDMYVGGNLITNDIQLKTTDFAGLTKTYATTDNAPAVMSGSKFTANYNYGRNVFIGNREVFLESAPILTDGVWYLPYNEIVSYLGVTPSNPVKTAIGGIEMISVDALVSSGAITSFSYDNTAEAIKLTAAVDSSTNLLTDDYTGMSNYNPLYYPSATPYVKATNNGGTWEYTASLASSTNAGIVRMLTDLYHQYGAGSYTISFEYKASASGKIKVGLAVDHTENKYSSGDISVSTSWQTKTWTVTLTDDPATIEQMALTFKPVQSDGFFGIGGSDLDGETISIRNITMVKN